MATLSFLIRRKFTHINHETSSGEMLLTGGVVLDAAELLEARDDGDGVDAGRRPAARRV